MNIARGWGPQFSLWVIHALDVSVEKPTVSITSSPKGHGEEKNDPTMTFRVYRSGPTDYALPVDLERVPDEELPDEAQQLGQIASEGADFTFSHSVTIPIGSDHADVPINIIDDTIAEGDEDVYIRVVDDGNKKYSATGEPAVGTISDDPRVGDVHVFVHPEMPYINTSLEFHFYVVIEAEGEALDRVNVTQAIAVASTSVTGWDGTPIDSEELADLYDNAAVPVEPSGILNSTDTPDWGPRSLAVLDDRKGVGQVFDEQQYVPFDVMDDPTVPDNSIGMLVTVNRKFHLEFKSAAGASLFQADWGYTWSNVPLKWVAPNPPAVSCTDWRLGAGKFTDPILITGLDSSLHLP